MMSDEVTIRFTIDIVVEPDEGGFHAFCPALKGLHVDGSTEEEAIQNAADAAMIHLESLIKHGDPIPVGVTIGIEAEQQGHVGRHAHRESLALSLT
jgi:predicted RNase H-like HicB family nuclease